MRMVRSSVVVILAVSVGLSVVPVSASPDPSSLGRDLVEHCVVHVVGQHTSGEFITTEPNCYSTFAEAMHQERLAGAPVAATDAGILATIGTHYDGANFTGASMTVSGTVCIGGWLNVSTTWNNRISSTRSNCTVRHYDGAGLTGAVQSTFAPGGNLTTLDNRTSSIQYN